MSSLNEHFKHSGYTLHRNTLPKNKLPQCCRENLRALDIGIKYLNPNGEDTVLPVYQCRSCGKQFAIVSEKYMLIDNILKFDTVILKK